MRIAHLLWNLGIGGIETMLVDIVNRQVKMPEVEQVSIIVVNNTRQESIACRLDPRIVVRWCKRKVGSRSIIPIARLNWFLLQQAPDIIHYHASEIRRMVFLRFPSVLTIHSTGYSPSIGKAFDAKYAISKAVHEEWAKLGDPNTIVVQNGIPLEEITKKQDYWERGKPFKIVQVSRIVLYHKGQDLLVRAAAALCPEVKKNINISFVGEGEDLTQLKKIVEESGLGDQVTFLGLKDRSWIYTHLIDYDLFVQPSLFEGFGLTVAEACAAGLPVLVSENEGPLEIIGNGKYGLTFKNKSVEDLTKKLDYIISEGYDEIIKVIDAARKNIYKHYDVSCTAKKYVEEYKKVLDNYGKNK